MNPLQRINHFAHYFPRHYYLIWGGTFINRLGTFVLPFFSIYLVRVYGFAPLQVGHIVAAYGLGSTLSGPIGGWLTDRYGRRPCMLSSLILGAILLLTLKEAHTYHSIMLNMGLYGLFGEMYRPASNAAIVDIVLPHQRTAAFDALYWAVNLGFAIGTLTGGVVTEYSFAPIFWINAVALLSFALIIGLFLPETKPKFKKEDPAPAGPGESEAPTPERPKFFLAAIVQKKSAALRYFLAPYRDSTFMWFMLATLFTTTLFFQGVTAFPITLNGFDIIGRRYGQLIAINGILITTLQPLIAAKTKSVKISQMIIIGFALNAIGFCLLAFATRYATFAMAVVLWTLGEICWIPRSNAALAYLAPAHLRGNYMGVNFVVWGMASVAAPLLGTALLQHYGRVVLWLSGAGIGMLAAVIVAAIKRRMDQRCSAE